MADLVVPRLGATVTEVEIIEWLVNDGDTVDAGEPVVSVATDKVEADIEATASGTLRQRASSGEIYPVGASIGAID